MQTFQTEFPTKDHMIVDAGNADTSRETGEPRRELDREDGVDGPQEMERK